MNITLQSIESPVFIIHCAVYEGSDICFEVSDISLFESQDNISYAFGCSVGVSHKMEIEYHSMIENETYEQSILIDSNRLLQEKVLDTLEQMDEMEMFIDICPNGLIGIRYSSVKKGLLDGLYVNSRKQNNIERPIYQQFEYRYEVRFGHWDEGEKVWKEYEEDEVKPELDYVEQALYDGTHDKLHDGGLMQYHQAGKPKKLALRWQIKKSEYMAYLWMEDMPIRAAFESFYNDYPEGKMDFVFYIDTEKKIYQIALSCEEAEEPRLLREDAYQMIVFKSKFEYHRSKNYNQPRGAWIW